MTDAAPLAVPSPHHSLAWQDWLNRLSDAMTAGRCRRIVLSCPLVESAVRATIRPVTLKRGMVWQWAERIGPGEVHRNLTRDDVLARVAKDAGRRFGEGRFSTPAGETAAVRLRSGDVKIRGPEHSSHASKPSGAEAAASSESPPVVEPLDHNRTKPYWIPEGSPCPFLVEAGVMTADGRVRAAMSHKFRQINRYLEFIADLVDELPTDRPISIVDYGCGKSYLTFAAHDLLTRRLNRTVEMLGLDRRDDVIATCTGIAERLSLAGLRFATGDIASHRPTGPVDLAISLHACDTATDDALLAAIAWGARAILAVPCCHHELSRRIESQSLDALLSYGLLRDRFSAMATDALRAEFLKLRGYRVQMLEFIELEHTPKNVLIRAVRRATSSESSPAKYLALKQCLGVGGWRLDPLDQYAGHAPSSEKRAEVAGPTFTLGVPIDAND